MCGAQTPLELLRQYMDYQQWYDRKDRSLCKIIQDVQFVAAMNPKAGSFHINPRLQRHFSVIGLRMPSDGEAGGG